MVYTRPTPLSPHQQRARRAVILEREGYFSTAAEAWAHVAAQAPRIDWQVWAAQRATLCVQRCQYKRSRPHRSLEQQD
ncbi:hypothetical protein PHA77_18920 (plasmid) [Edwardsiella tarda]|nr:hypothetical protein [Edwardsiella tarda]WGE31086.1 hypothetical protein PHA77_18920 [Edwardsiella tarda]